MRTSMIPLVSVIMPAYGHERFVGPAIESVLAQTLNDWELIVIDDCSPDGTWDEIRRFRDPQIIASRHDVNRGAHATLNEGLVQARGSYVAILNSDDVYHAERLERTVGYLASREVDLVGSAVRLIDVAGVVIEDQGHDWIQWYRSRLELLGNNIEIGDALWGGNLFVTTSNFVFRRALAGRVGGFADLRYAHDYAFLLAAITQSSASVAFLGEEPLLDYRWHGGNTIRENAWKAGQEEFGVVCQYLPLLLPESVRTRAELALQHLSGLALTTPSTDMAHVVRLHQEIVKLLSELAESRAEADWLRTEVAGSRTEVDWLRTDIAAQLTELAGSQTEVARLRAEIAALVTELAALMTELAASRAEVDRLHTDIGVLRGSYSFRVGSALFYPLRYLRGLVTGRS